MLQVQIAERVRAVRDEQQKAERAPGKLEALRKMERSLLRDRIASWRAEAAVARAAAAVAAAAGGGR